MGLDRSTFLNNVRRKKIKWAIVLVTLVVGTAVYSFFSDGDPAEAAEDGLTEISVEKEDVISVEEEEKKDEPELIFVDVCGAVNSSNVVCIPEGSRVFEAIEAAGGTNEEAELKYINLAAVCQDGQKLYVPTKAETDAQSAAGGVKAEGPASVTDQSLMGIPGANTSGGTVNINTANSEELQTISGIGPSMASRILEYREQNGGFKRIEDLKNVSGIGERTFEKLKDKVSL